MNVLAPIAIILLVSLLLAVLTLRLRRLSGTPALRELAGVARLAKQTGQAVESGSRLHLSLGQGELTEATVVSSAAGLAVLDSLAEESCASDTPPLVTVGAGTLLPAGQDSLRAAYQKAGRARDFWPGDVQFIAPATSPTIYAAGVASAIHNTELSSNVLVGRFGPEIVLATEAAAQKQLEQLIGSDDPVALAIGSMSSEQLLIGEELLATPAYLQPKPVHQASLMTQDLLRWLVAAAVVIAAVVGLLT
jgi:hypothetical protein